MLKSIITLSVDESVATLWNSGLETQRQSTRKFSIIEQHVQSLWKFVTSEL